MRNWLRKSGKKVIPIGGFIVSALLLTVCAVHYWIPLWGELIKDERIVGLELPGTFNIPAGLFAILNVPVVIGYLLLLETSWLEGSSNDLAFFLGLGVLLFGSGLWWLLVWRVWTEVGRMVGLGRKQGGTRPNGVRLTK